MQMRKKILLIIIFLVFIATAAFSVKPAVVFIARKQMQRVLGGSTVSVQDCQWNLLSRLSLTGVKVQKPGAYDLSAGEIRIEYNPWAICRGKIAKLVLKDIAATVEMPRQDVLGLRSDSASPSRPGLQLENLELEGLRLNLKLKDLTVTAVISAAVDVPARSVRSLDGEIVSLEGQGVLLENGTIKTAQGIPGNLFIQKFQCGKLKVDDIKAGTRLSGKALSLESLSGRTLNGEVAGEVTVTLDTSLEYFAQLRFVNLDLDGFVNDFDLKEKFQMSGMMSGRMTVTGRNQNFKIIDGVFSSSDPGGILVIKNNEFLENIARSSQQPLDIVVASLKNYHYNVGVLKLFLEKGNLIFDMALDGETGKRNIQITVHDFNLTP